MEYKSIVDVIMNIGQYLASLVRDYGVVTYFIMFAFIFCETGLVVTPFLPGDSLIFTAGTLAASGLLRIELLILLIGLAAVIGDSVNYFIGRTFGTKLLRKDKSFFFNKKYLERTEAFYQRHGRKTIIIARVIPVIRTVAPFVAGIGKMEYRHFFLYNVIGGFGWVALFSLGGYLFGNLPFVKANFSLVVTLIILISLIPVIFAVTKALLRKMRKSNSSKQNDMQGCNRN